MNGIAYFEIQAVDINRAVGFYRSVFGWIFTKEMDIPMEYWRIETDSIRGGLMKNPLPPAPPQTSANSFVCSVQVSNFDAVAKTILNAHGQVAYPKFAVPGVCWQGYFLDTEGNTFGIFQPDPDAK